ncbi:MAG: type II toxin-antitoxin system RelE/ParE family toxin [Ignavibacteriales bacterium]|nr:type II toxin-antitoxin system RelE/ParE family toxin [Ignavibacteriales bacterium]
MKIFWAPLAVERLENIFEYISKDNSTAAYKMIERIFSKVEKLSEYPERGRKVPEANREEIREIFEGEYRIIYRVEPKRIFVLSIRNFKQLLPDKELG